MHLKCICSGITKTSTPKKTWRPIVKQFNHLWYHSIFTSYYVNISTQHTCFLLAQAKLLNNLWTSNTNWLRERGLTYHVTIRLLCYTTEMYDTLRKSIWSTSIPITFYIHTTQVYKWTLLRIIRIECYFIRIKLHLLYEFVTSHIFYLCNVRQVIYSGMYVYYFGGGEGYVIKNVPFVGFALRNWWED